MLLAYILERSSTFVWRQQAVHRAQQLRASLCATDQLKRDEGGGRGVVFSYVTAEFQWHFSVVIERLAGGASTVESDPNPCNSSC